MNYNIKQTYKNIFLITSTDSYDLAMLFCRAQEFYESPIKGIKGCQFTMSQFQRLYSKKFGEGCFTYPNDWVGFNVPDYILEECYFCFPPSDINEYDDLMISIYNEISEEICDDGSFYLIGSQAKSKETIQHELCHALFYLDNEYKQKVKDIINSLYKSTFACFREHLLAIGYSKQSIIDEINAYICVNSYQLTDSSPKMNKKEKKNFTETQLKLQSMFNEALSNRKNKK